MHDRRRIGDVGEQIAGDFLSAQGMIILERQYKKSFGEIDLICLDGEEVVFVEVKTRRTPVFGYPEDSVTQEKIRHILHVAEVYLQEKHLCASSWRIDVIAIEYQKELPKITHLKNIDIPEALW